MRRFWLTTLLFGTLMSGGCTLHQVKGEVGGVSVEASSKSSSSAFCPPGQAKKGRC